MSNRPDGSGTVYQDKRRGDYVGEVWLDGKRRRVTGPNKTEAGRRLRALVQEHGRGELSDGNATVSDAVQLWRDRVLVAKDFAPSTRELYEWSCDIVVAELGKVRLRKLTPERIEQALDKQANRPVRPLIRRSLKHVRSTLGQVLDFAQRRKLIGANPARIAELTPTAARMKPRRSLDPAQAAELWRVMGAEGTYGALFRVQLSTGLRPGEAAGLCWDSIDLESDTPCLTVRRAVRSVKSRAELVDELKTTASYRTVGVSPEIVEMLQAQRTRVAAMQLAAPDWIDRGLVFPSSTGGPLDAANRRRALARICRNAGLPELSPNELRHTAASLLIDDGAPVELVADLLGHSNFRMLAEHYRHRVRPVVDVAAVARYEVAE